MAKSVDLDEDDFEEEVLEKDDHDEEEEFEDEPEEEPSPRGRNTGLTLVLCLLNVGAALGFISLPLFIPDIVLGISLLMLLGAAGLPLSLAACSFFSRP